MADFWNEKPEQGGFLRKTTQKKLPAAGKWQNAL